MNIFQSFQPNKQKQSISNNEKMVQPVVPAPRPAVSSLKAFLLNLDNDPLILSVSNENAVDGTDTKGKAAKAKLAHMPAKATKLVRLKDFSTHNTALYKHIAIEANFDITSLISLDKSIQPEYCYTYPSNRRLAENYALSDFMTRNLSKTRHWAMQESDLPYFNQGLLGNITATASAGASLMLGGSSSGAVSSGPATGPPEHEAALLATQSRMLKWQDALYTLLRELYAASSPPKLISGEQKSPVENAGFLMLGRSLLLPATAPNSAATNNGTIVSLPYTSAIFYHVQRSDLKQSSVGAGAAPSSSTSASPTATGIEPACLLIGVHKSLLTRLHQLGAQCSLVEDLAHPWTSPNSTAPTSANAELKVTATRGTIDPHASTSALLNNKKIGINLVLTGRFSVSAAAEAMLESVFAFVHGAGRPSTSDVPILMAHRSFPHAVSMAWDRRPVQCDHKFTPAPAKNSTMTKNNTESAEDAAANAFHKINLQGLISATALPKLVEELRRLAESQVLAAANSGYSTQRNKRRKCAISTAYNYLRQKEGSNANKFGSSADLRNIPGAAAAALPLISSSAPPAPPPAVNPMILVTTASLKYSAVESSESEGEQDTSGDEKEEGQAAQTIKPKNDIAADERGTAVNKRKYEDVTINKRTNSKLAHEASTGTGAPSELRAEDWLKARRQEAAPYFLLQLSVLTPRCVQMSYAHSSAHRADTSAEPGTEAVVVNSADGEFVLRAEPLVDEIRWQNPQNKNAAVSNASTVNANDYVEVVTTTQPLLRARWLQPPKAKTVNAHHDPDQIEEMEEHGVVLDALNKYSIYVASKQM